MRRAQFKYIEAKNFEEETPMDMALFPSIGKLME